jgi:hypothetical protein
MHATCGQAVGNATAGRAWVPPLHGAIAPLQGAGAHAHGRQGSPGCGCHLGHARAGGAGVLGAVRAHKAARGHATRAGVLGVWKRAPHMMRTSQAARPVHAAHNMGRHTSHLQAGWLLPPSRLTCP